MAESTRKPGIADTFTRLMRLNVAGGPPPLSAKQLIEESETQLERAARSGTVYEQQVAGQILASPLEYRRWESEHARAMAQVAGAPRIGLQMRALLSNAFTLIHRKALFEYLRDRAPRGGTRRTLIRHFHGDHSYTQSIVAEHGNYLRGAASLLCTEKIGTTLLAHQAFGEPLDEYERLYGEYFASYCDSVLLPGDGGGLEGDSVRSLLTYLKRDILEVRTRLLAMPPVPERRRQPRA
jgi:hypothetical protein